MQVLIPDDRRAHRDSLRKLLQREREVQVSGIAEESEIAPDRAIARELRRALDGCPICEGSYRDHSYSILATVDIAEHWQSPLRVKEYPEEEGNSLLALLPPERWRPLRSVCSRLSVGYTQRGLALPLHTFVRLEPIPGKEQQLREELKLLLEPTRAEPGCIRIHLYEALHDPMIFYIHSEWVDEAAFDAHPKLPHMTRFLDLVRGLVTRPVKGIRTKQIH